MTTAVVSVVSERTKKQQRSAADDKAYLLNNGEGQGGPGMDTLSSEATATS